MTIDKPFKSLTIGETFSRTFHLLIEQFVLFMCITGMVMILYLILVLAVGAFVFNALYEGRHKLGPELFRLMHREIACLVQMMGYELCTVIGRGEISHAVAMLYIGRQPGWLHCVKSNWSRKCSLFIFGILMCGAELLTFLPAHVLRVKDVAINDTLTLTLATLVGIAFASFVFYAYIGMMMTGPAIMVEGFANPIKAMWRSRELATGSPCDLLVWTLFGLWLMEKFVLWLLHNMCLTSYWMKYSIMGNVGSVLPMLFFFPLRAM
jgi:hypothetical protein